jgi:hypothetical protein
MPNRRAVLLSGLAVATTSLPHQIFAQTDFSLDDFIALSSTLTGAPVSALDVHAARIMLDAFRERGLSTALAQLANQASPGVTASPLRNEVVAAWYSGVCKTAKGSVVATYTQALCWRNSTFLHPAGWCGGATGYWGQPPVA